MITLLISEYGLLVGNSPEAWVWEIASHTLYHNGENMGMYPGPIGLEMPRRFRMKIDREQGQLTFNIGLGDNVVFKGEAVYLIPSFTDWFEIGIY